MRKELEAFIEESFAGLPPSPETEQAKAQVRKRWRPTLPSTGQGAWRPGPPTSTP